MHSDYAVLVKNACKSYGKKQILQELCMKVERGTIYGLLGPSGCGKTTLLSCIVGRKKFNEGEIWVMGGTPGSVESGVPGHRVGYMPQDVALVGELSVKGCVLYFGRILDMPDELIEQRYYQLKKLLELPPDDRLVRDCSGGQQRRVSFAAAMVHEPELLILDEPTVGLDPVLRDRIWEYLVKITQTKKIAVIITTHYIEEAKQANTIGLMREGKLLAEESPVNLMSRFGKDSLEEVFLLLSKKQEEGSLSDMAVNNVHSNQNGKPYMPEISMVMAEMGHGSKEFLTEKQAKAGKIKIKAKNKRATLNKNRMKALLGKNWMQYSRNLSGVCWTLAFPVIQIFAFFLAIGTDIKDIKVGIVNKENIANLCGTYDPLTTTRPLQNSECNFTALGCRFIDELTDPMIAKVPYNNLETAKNAINTGNVAGVIYLAENFTSAFQQRLDSGRDVTDSDVDFGEIKVWLDMSNRQIGSVLKYKLFGQYFDFQEKVFNECNYSSRLGSLPVRFEKPVYGEVDEPYTIFMISGVMMTIMFFMGTTMTSTIIISDRMEGVWDRSIVAGVTSSEILLTHLITQFILILIQVGEVMAIAFGIYRINCLGNFGILIMMTVLEGLCGMCFGFFISIISDNHNMANIAATGSFFPMIIICGLIWPLEAQPTPLRWVSMITPFTIPILSFRNVMVRGWDIMNFDVYLGISVEVLWILFLSGINLFTMKTKR